MVYGLETAGWPLVSLNISYFLRFSIVAIVAGAFMFHAADNYSEITGFSMDTLFGAIVQSDWDLNISKSDILFLVFDCSLDQ